MTRFVDAVGFDLDGTLVDSMAVAPSVYARVVRSLGGPDLTVDDVTAMWHIGPTSTVLGHFLRRPITPADLELFHDTFEEATRSIEPFDGVATMLRDLSDHGFRLGVYATATRRAAVTMLVATGLADRVGAVVGAVVGGDEVTEPKPAVDGLRRLAHAIGTTPERIAYVGDTSVDLQCADAAGSVGILAGWGAADGTSDVGTTTAWKPGDVVDLVLVETRGRHANTARRRSREWPADGFELRGTRTEMGVDTFDLLLDLVVLPDLTWSWKDEYEHACRLGLITEVEQVAVREARDEAVSLIETQAGPVAGGETAWRPDPGWPTPELPLGVDSA